jgi:hypothetical protein
MFFLKTQTLHKFICFKCFLINLVTKNYFQWKGYVIAFQIECVRIMNLFIDRFLVASIFLWY